jgi:UDP-N-acetyl-D-glucosamine dehydrogenase
MPLQDQGIGVVGLGTVGAQELTLWHQGGYQVVGYDLDPVRLRSLEAASPNGTGPPVWLTDSLRDLEACSVLIVCLPTLDAAGRPSLAAFDRFLASLDLLPKADRLTIVTSTVPIGFCGQLARQLGSLGKLLAYVPERFDPGSNRDFQSVPRVAGATSGMALRRTVELYATVGVRLSAVEPIEIAEASKLLENAFRLVNISFINEFARLCRHVGVPAADVIAAAATKPFAFMAHSPGAGAGGRCIPTIPAYLLAAGQSAGLDMPVLTAAMTMNHRLPQRIAQELRLLLAESGTTRGRVLLLGLTYKPNEPDARGSAALRVAMALAAEHDVTIVDPIVPVDQLPPGLRLFRKLPMALRYDAVVVAVRHRGFDPTALAKLSPIILDLVTGEVRQRPSARSRTARRSDAREDSTLEPQIALGGGQI